MLILGLHIGPGVLKFVKGGPGNLFLQSFLNDFGQLGL